MRGVRPQEIDALASELGDLEPELAAAIILQQLSTRLRQSDLPWQLSEAEILEKRYDWACKTIKSSEEIIARYRGTS